METQQKKQYCYTTSLRPDGTKKAVYLGKTSSPQGKKHQQKMEEKRTRRDQEETLNQLHAAVDEALKALDMMKHAQLLTIGLYQRRSEIRTLQEDARCHTTMN
jgi:hypothetical protein